MELDKTLATDRFRAAERQGLKLAIFCRTLAIGAAAVWSASAAFYIGDQPDIPSILTLAAYFAVGIIYLRIIGSRWDHELLKYAIYGADILGACALFVLLPANSGEDVPQIFAFRKYGIYFLFPMIALSTLALSWRLVIWTGLIAVIGWWSAFLVIVSEMNVTLSWADLPLNPTAEDFQSVFLSPEFIGTGTRVDETGALIVCALILALAVYRARGVFFAQIAAEEETKFISEAFGEYVPRQLVMRLLDEPEVLTPKSHRSTIICVDIAGFTTIVERSTPEATIGMLNEFFTESAMIISRHDGVIVNYSGDGFLAAFNAPLPVENPEELSLQASRELLSLVDGRTFSGEKLSIRIGIATGDVAAGSVGGGGRRVYTVYGDTVNLAARLQEIAKGEGLSLLMDGETAAALSVGQVSSISKATKIRGRSAVVQLFTASSAALSKKHV